ncbi:MAG: hypothetical protein ACK2UG_09885 [Candidatus Promineifilaceae bacterium]|jgi:predicted NACHT family NTPase
MGDQVQGDKVGRDKIGTQINVHHFPNPQLFVTRLLQDGRAIVLFDGLDEVNLAGDKRSHMISMLNNFVYQ